MNYLDLINKCLVELNYKKVNNFDELVKNDHLKIKNILNILNSEICMFDNWNFLLRKTKLVLPKGSAELDNPICGKLKTLSIENNKLQYLEDFDTFFLNQQPQNAYSVFNDKILFAPSKKSDRTIDVVYYTGNFVKNENGEEKLTLEFATDESLIPESFCEPLLVYGTCMRLKANPQYSKFNYWYGMYKDNLATMRSKLCTDVNSIPTISIKRM